MSIRPKQFARLGEFHLEEAVLDVLLEAKHNNQCLGAAEVSKRAGIFRKPGEGIRGAPGAFNDAIVTGVLIKLIRANKVERCDINLGSGKGDGWTLSEDEFNTRRDDVDLD